MEAVTIWGLPMTNDGWLGKVPLISGWWFGT